MSVTYAGPEWKTVHDWPRYEISEEGQVRIRAGRYTGLILKRFWRDGGHNEKAVRGNSHIDCPGSLCVDISDGERHTMKRIWKLMEKYWPGKHYPKHWKAERYKASPIKKNNTPDERFKLTPEERMKILLSPLSAKELSEIYPVGRRYIHYIRTGK